jgi:imidazolonepropionase
MRELNIIQDGALLIIDGKVQQVGPSRRVERLALARDAIDVDASGKVVIPAFVDCQASLLCGPACSLDRATAIRAVRSFSPQRMELEARKRLRQFVRSGTATVAAGCGYGLDGVTELRALRALASLDGRPIRLVPHFLGTMACPPEFTGHEGEYLDTVAASILPAVARKKLASALIVSDHFPREVVHRTIAAGADLALAVHLHSSTGTTIGGEATVRGLEDADEAAVASLAQGKALCVLLPGESYQRGAGSYPPGRALTDAGVAVALATGYDHLTSPTASMPMIMSIACTQMKLTHAEALVASTINAAHVLGLAGQTGSLEANKDADVLIANTGDYRDLAHFFGLNLVAAVIHKGQPVYPRVESTV